MNTEDLSVGLRGEDLGFRGDADFRGEDFGLSSKVIREESGPSCKGIRAFVGIQASVERDSGFRGEDSGLSWEGVGLSCGFRLSWG